MAKPTAASYCSVSMSSWSGKCEQASRNEFEILTRFSLRYFIVIAKKFLLEIIIINFWNLSNCVIRLLGLH